MTDREAFVRAICTDPTDDTPRLVFADWLDERGEADRAELIRIQITLARNPPAYPADLALEVRTRELLDAHRADWPVGVPPNRTREWDRGFVCAFTLRVDDFDLLAPVIFANHPIERLFLHLHPEIKAPSAWVNYGRALAGLPPLDPSPLPVHSSSR